MALTFGRRIDIARVPGAQLPHANFHADANGFYICSSGKVYAYSPAGAREDSRDITLENLPTTQTVWGFTRLSDGRWAVCTREQLAANTVGALRIFEANGSAQHVKNIPAVLQGFLAERFGNPKALAHWDDKLYVRVARPGVTGRLRFLRFDMVGDVEDADLTFPNVNPTALSDATAIGGFLIAIYQTQRIAYGVTLPDFADAPAIQTNLEARNTNPFGASAFDGTLYVYDRSNPDAIFTYTGIPGVTPSTPAGGPSYGIGLSIIQMFFTNELLGREWRRA